MKQKLSIDEIKGCKICTEDCAVFHRFDQGTLEQKKDDIYTLAREIMDVERDKKEHMKEFTEKLKKLKGMHNNVVEEVSREGYHKTEMCYGVPDYDKKTITFYSENGVAVKQRRMTTEEMAVDTDVIQLANGTNGGM